VTRYDDAKSDEVHAAISLENETQALKHDDNLWGIVEAVLG
jgi:hypothetical protein